MTDVATIRLGRFQLAMLAGAILLSSPLLAIAALVVAEADFQRLETRAEGTALKFLDRLSNVPTMELVPTYDPRHAIPTPHPVPIVGDEWRIGMRQG